MTTIDNFNQKHFYVIRGNDIYVNQKLKSKQYNVQMVKTFLALLLGAGKSKNCF